MNVIHTDAGPIYRIYHRVFDYTKLALELGIGIAPADGHFNVYDWYRYYQYNGVNYDQVNLLEMAIEHGPTHVELD